VALEPVAPGEVTFAKVGSRGTLLEVGRPAGSSEMAPASAEKRSSRGSGKASARSATAPGHPLRGRDTALVTIGEHLDRLLDGLGTVLVIEGAAGLGKTRLLQEVAAMASQLSIRVGTGAADPGDTMVQLSPLMEALFKGARPILERGSLADTHVSPEERYWLLQDVEALLERSALEAPALICLDDLQWADSGTAAALRALPGRLASVPVGWVIALRPDSGLPSVRASLEYLERNGAERVVLGPLGPTAVAQIATDVLLAEPDEPLLEVTERASGNPFLLVELLWGLRDEELVRVESGRAQLVEPRMPQRVTDTMRGRLGRVSGTARQVATVAASLGRRFSLSDVAAMLDLAPSALLMPIEELAHANLLVERDDKLAFAHDLTLEAVRASVPLSARKALDRQAALVLLEGGALPVEVAQQLAASAEPGDEVAITTLLRASEALGPSDPGAAANLSQRALELAAPKHPLRGPLVAGTTISLFAAGRSAEAKAFADTALRQVLPAEQEAAVRRSIAGMFSLSPDVRADASRAALDLPGLPPEFRARHLALLFHNLVTAGRAQEARVVLDAATAAVQNHDNVGGRFVLELAESGLAYAYGEFDRALELVEAALRTSVDATDGTRAHLARVWRCEVLNLVDRFDESLQCGTDNVAAAQRDRQAWALHTYETARARQLLIAGRLADAAAILDERFSPDAANEVVGVLDAAGVVALSRVATHRGDQVQVEKAGEIARVMMNQDAPSVRRHGLWLLALQALADDQPVRALEWLCRDGEDERMSIVPLFPMDGGDEVRLVRIALAAGDRELALYASRSSSSRSKLNPEASCLAAVAAHTRALVNQDPAELAKAVELFERGPRRLALGGALEDFGVLSLESGATPQAVDAFGRALVLFAQAGASWDAGRLRGRLRAVGVRRRLVAAHRPRSGWEAISESELAVARLVVQGFTNREVAERLFVSRHTVSGHLRSIFMKLNVNSRVELARIASNYGLGG
jgi:DNA-binding CsgD family transcriptional regulator